MKRLIPMLMAVGAIAAYKLCAVARPTRTELRGTLEARSGEIYFSIARNSLSEVSIGDVLPIRVTAFPDETFLGRIDRFDDPMRVHVISRTDELIGGMPATIIVN